MAWTLATLFSTVYILLFRLSLRAVFAFATLYGLLLIVTICSLNIVIWNQNRHMQIQRLTKALSLVSVGTLSSWIPAIIFYLLRIKYFRSKHIFKHSPFHLFYTFFQFFYQSNGVHIKNS